MSPKTDNEKDVQSPKKIKSVPAWEETPRLTSYVLILITLSVGIALTMFLVFKFEKWETFLIFSRYFGGDTSPFSERQAPPGVKRPRLQVDELNDITTYQERELKRLNSFGWVNKEQNIVHIPIHKAMEKLARRSNNSKEVPPVENSTSPEKSMTAPASPTPEEHPQQPPKEALEEPPHD